MQYALIRNAQFSFIYSTLQCGPRWGTVRRLVEGEIVFESGDFEACVDRVPVPWHCSQNIASFIGSEVAYAVRWLEQGVLDVERIAKLMRLGESTSKAINRIGRYSPAATLVENIGVKAALMHQKYALELYRQFNPKTVHDYIGSQNLVFTDESVRQRLVGAGRIGRKRAGRATVLQKPFVLPQISQEMVDSFFEGAPAFMTNPDDLDAYGPEETGAIWGETWTICTRFTHGTTLALEFLEELEFIEDSKKVYWAYDYYSDKLTRLTVFPGDDRDVKKIDEEREVLVTNVDSKLVLSEDDNEYLNELLLK